MRQIGLRDVIHRLYCAFLALIALIIVSETGCGNKDDKATLYNLKYDSVMRVCCTDYYYATFSDKAAGATRFYWLSVAGKHSQALMLQPPFENEWQAVKVTYLDKIQASNYDLCVYSCNNIADVGNVKNATGAAGPVMVFIDNFQELPCATTCCTSVGKKYVGFQKNAPGVIGAQANILTRYGELCGAPTSTNPAASYAFCSVNKTVGDSTLWAQTGYGYIRYPDSMTMEPFFYAEMRGDRFWRWYSSEQEAGAPSEGYFKSYESHLDIASGSWAFLYNNQVSIEFPEQALWTSPGDNVQWFGEITHMESDMPGTKSAPCVFAQPRYRIDGNPLTLPVSYEAEDWLHSDNESEWGVDWKESNGYIDSLYIWDEEPLP